MHLWIQINQGGNSEPCHNYEAIDWSDINLFYANISINECDTVYKIITFFDKLSKLTIFIRVVVKYYLAYVYTNTWLQISELLCIFPNESYENKERVLKYMYTYIYISIFTYVYVKTCMSMCLSAGM